MRGVLGILLGIGIGWLLPQPGMHQRFDLAFDRGIRTQQAWEDCQRQGMPVGQAAQEWVTLLKELARQDVQQYLAVAYSDCAAQQLFLAQWPPLRRVDGRMP